MVLLQVFIGYLLICNFGILNYAMKNIFLKILARKGCFLTATIFVKLFISNVFIKIMDLNILYYYYFSNYRFFYCSNRMRRFLGFVDLGTNLEVLTVILF